MPSEPLSSSLHQAILCRFDGYSTALFFARWPNGRLLWPEPLPEGFQPADLDMLNDGELIRRAVLQQFSIQDEDLE